MQILSLERSSFCCDIETGIYEIQQLIWTHQDTKLLVIFENCIQIAIYNLANKTISYVGNSKYNLHRKSPSFVQPSLPHV